MEFEFNGSTFKKVPEDAPELKHKLIEDCQENIDISGNVVLGVDNTDNHDCIDDTEMPPPCPISCVRQYHSRNINVISYDEEKGTFVVVDSILSTGNLPYDWTPVLFQNRIVWYKESRWIK